MKELLLKRSIIQTIITFGIILMMSTLSFSQNRYPIKSVINNDTVFIINKQQFITVNLKLAQLNELSEITGNQEEEIILLNRSVEAYIKQSNLQKTIITKKNGVITEKNNIIELKDTKIKSTKKQRNLLIGASGILLVLLIIL